MNNAKLIKVIETSSVANAENAVTKRYWTTDGALLAERHPDVDAMDARGPCGYVVVAGTEPLMDTVGGSKADAIEKFKAHYRGSLGTEPEGISWREFSEARGYSVRPLYFR